MSTIETDYLVVGAGASGMAFTDALIAEADVEVVIVDRRHKPGGHWNDAYPFVRLHQPSAFYGVNSSSLGQDRIDASGPNAGFYERATSAEICAYYQHVMDDFLRTGAVRFLAMSRYLGEDPEGHRVTSLLTGQQETIRVRRALVDASYLEGEIPATHTAPFVVDEDAQLVPPNGLVTVDGSASGYTVIGSGKTGMDACSWLLEEGVPPDRIRWIKPRESWGLNRAKVQPREQVASVIEGAADDMESAAAAADLDDLFRRLEDSGRFLRVDTNVDATMYRGATLGEAEVEALRSIDDVVRLGRVRRIGSAEVVMERGSVAADREQVYVDCTARGIPAYTARPIFEPGRITIQSVRVGLIPFNAAMIGYIEATREEVPEKNRLCPPNTNPNTALDWLPTTYASTRADMTWGHEPDVTAWLERSRLNLAAGLREHLGEQRMQVAIGRLLEQREPGLANLERLMDAAGRRSA